jgi:transcriptional regulator with XRE-family HTH domain
MDLSGWQVFVPDRGLLIGQREKLGLTQEEVAKRANIKLEQYQCYEKHDGQFSRSSMRIVKAIFDVLGLDLTAYSNGDYCLRPLEEDEPAAKTIRNLKL